MSTKSTSRGLLYWTDEEKNILLENLDKTPEELKLLLPGRSTNAIYCRARYITTHKKWKGSAYSLVKLKRQKSFAKSTLKKVKLPKVPATSKHIEVTSEVEQISFKVANVEVTVKMHTKGNTNLKSSEKTSQPDRVTGDA